MPTGDAPTTSEWSTILLPTKVRLILEILWYAGFGNIYRKYCFQTGNLNTEFYGYWRCQKECLGDVSLTFRELSKIFSRNLYTVLLKSYFLWEFQAETLYVCPKHGFGHTYKVSAWNSQHKCHFWHCIFSRYYLESSGNVSETSPWLLPTPSVAINSMVSLPIWKPWAARVLFWNIPSSAHKELMISP